MKRTVRATRSSSSPVSATGCGFGSSRFRPSRDAFALIVFDPRGVARSEWRDEAISIKDIADDVAALLSALDIESAHILGASFGGFVAQEFALGFPEMTRMSDSRLHEPRRRGSTSRPRRRRWRPSPRRRG